MVNSEHWLHCNGETDLIKKKNSTLLMWLPRQNITYLYFSP